MYWGEISQQDMQAFLLASKEKGWKKALAELCKKYPEKKDFLVRTIKGDISRWRWLSHLPIHKHAKVLDFGCGMGAISHKLATLTSYLTSLDVVKERLDFTCLRIKQDGLKTKGVNTHWSKLPKKPVFDAIICMGVIEWIPLMENSAYPQKTQEHVLKAFYSSMRKEGKLVLGIENRFAYDYFLGKVQHDDIMFTSIMPRWMANIYYRVRRGRIYQTYTHSYYALKRLIEKTGFSEVTVYLAHPTYQSAKYLYNPKDKESIKKVIASFNNKGILRKLRNFVFLWSNYVGIYKYFATHYLVIAKK